MKISTVMVIGIAGLIGAAGVVAGGMHRGGHGHHPMHSGGHMGDRTDMVHWTAPADAASRENPIAATHESISKGSALYAQYCASCHGTEGRGDGPAGAALDPRPANLAVMGAQHPAGDLAWKIAHGRGAMPAWKDVLQEEQIWDLVNYVKSLQPGA